MRRMRPHWQYFLFAVPAVAVALGVQILSKNSKYSAGRSPAATTSTLQNKLAQLNQDEDEPTEDLSKSAKEPKKTKDLKVAEAKTIPAAADANGVCISIEYPGRGPENAAISNDDWHTIIGQFHNAKSLLTAWLEAHQSQFSKKTYQWMSTQVTGALLQRPVNPPAVNEEPDLMWRGVAVLDEGKTGAPVVRVGGGFAKLVLSQPERGRFEFARVLAQTWAPCQIAKVDATSPWKGFLGCMKLDGEADATKACGQNTYSEAGWAVSSAVAAIASPPGCRIPAFEKISATECVKKVGVSL
jgi:hypothetical protein